MIDGDFDSCKDVYNLLYQFSPLLASRNRLNELLHI